MPRHRHQEFMRFLRAIDRNTPKALDLHLVTGNYATHKHPKAKDWLKRHTRFHQRRPRRPGSIWSNASSA